MKNKELIRVLAFVIFGILFVIGLHYFQYLNEKAEQNYVRPKSNYLIFKK